MISETKVAPGARTSFIDNDGAFIHPLTGEPGAQLVDRDLMVYALKAGYAKQGARIGARETQAEAFCEAMRAFWSAKLA